MEAERKLRGAVVSELHSELRGVGVEVCRC